MARRYNIYASAAGRHFRDADFLLAGPSLNRMNADQLYGLSWECALKALMIGLGMPISRKRMPKDKKDQVHAEKAIHRLRHWAGTRGQNHYLQLLGYPNSNPFDTWRVDQRYLRDGRTPLLRTVIQHQTAAAKAEQTLRRAILDGFIRP